MRKVTRIIMAVSMIITMFFTLVSNMAMCTAETTSKEQQPTETNTDFEVNVGSTEGKFGDLVTVPISFKNVPAESISTCSLKINYDPTKLEYVTIKGGSIIPYANTDFAGDKKTDGNLDILFLCYQPVSGHDITLDGVFAELTFKVIDSTIGSTPVEIKESIFGDKYLNPVHPIINSGMVEIYISEFKPFELKVGATEGKVGDLVTIPISFKNVPIDGIELCNIAITYDSTQLEYSSGEAGPLIKKSGLCGEASKVSQGEIKVGTFDPFMGEQYINSDGVLVNLIFKITDNSDKTLVQIKNATIADRLLNILAPTLYDGIVYIDHSGVLTQEVYKVSGYIESDFQLSTATGSKAREGFKVEIVGTAFNALTDANGYFEIKDVPAGTYDIKISKPCYLTRHITNISVNSDKELSAKSTPISLWIGDVNENGSINMEDIMIICKSFNSNAGDNNYKECRDLNCDGAINIEDIVIVAKHFNSISSDYQ